jgi:6-phosphogluconolactonase (cycloisomerase 2 family)
MMTSDHVPRDAAASLAGFARLAGICLISVLGLLSGCGSSHSSGAQLTQVSSIEVGPPDSKVAMGLASQFTATGIMGDGSRRNISAQVAWSSSNPAIARMDAGGTAATVRSGTATIMATLNGVSGSTSLTVTPATLLSIEITPPNPGFANGLTLQLVATGIYSDNSTHDLTAAVTWSSSSSAVASISNSAGCGGLATALSPGVTTVTATLGSVSASMTLTVTAATLVSIGVTPMNSTLPNGLSMTLKATGVFTDHSTADLTSAVTWSSSAPAVVSVDNAPASGLATAQSPGTAQLTATLGGVSGATTLTVTAATLVSIGVTPANPGLAEGLKAQFTATGTYTDNSTQNLTAIALWSSSNPALASVSNAAGFEGNTTALGTGAVTVTAALGTIQGSTTLTVTPATLVSIAVTPANPSFAAGTTQQFTATGSYTDNSTQNLTTAVVWSSSSSGVAAVSNAAGSNGLATGLGQGASTIGAAFGGVSGSTTLNVTPATLVSLTVIPANPSTPNGTTQQFTVSGTYTDNSTQLLTSSVSWSSSDPSIAAVSNAAGTNGLASTLATGSVIVTASLGTVSGSTNLTVTPATLVSIAVIPATPSIAAGTAQQFAATGTYTDGSTQPLTQTAAWSSSDTTVATVSNAPGTNGLASSVGQGTANITATVGSIAGSTSLSVTPSTLVAIAVTPVTPSITSRSNEQFTATGTYTDGSMQNLTGAVTWISSNLATATISNAAGSNGLAAAAAAGSTSISAMLGSIGSPAVTLTVTAAPEYAYVANQNANTVSEFAVGAGGALTLIGTVATGNEPNAVVVDPTGRYVYVANWTDGTISEYAVGSDGTLTNVGTAPAGSEPSSIAIDTTGQYVYVANLAGNTVSQYVIGAGGVLASLGTVAAAGSPISITADPAGHYVYVADETGNAVSEFAIGAGGLLSLLGTVPTGNDPQSVTVDPSGSYAYVANWNDATVSAYTIASDGTLTPIGTVASGSCPESVAVDPAGPYVYAENYCSNTVSEYAIGTGGVLSAIGTVATGNNPWFISIDPTGSDVYVVNFSDSTVSEFNIGAGGALGVIGTVPTGSGPNAVIAGY